MKWLITADIHLNDYKDYNYSLRSRLYQFTKLAYRYVEIAKEHNIDTLLILGDLIDKPTNRPYVVNELNEFISILKSYFNKIYYIVGQHCMDAKSDNVDHNDTILKTYDDDKFIYMHHKIFEIDNHIFGFQDWTPEQDITWTNKHLDILFGHYTKSNLFGQDIDESRFDLMIHGDIHNSQVIGKFISVCNPIQHDFNSETEGKVIVFDTLTLEWNRVLVDPDHTRFLQLHYTNEHSQEGFHGELDYYVFRPEFTQSNEVTEDNDLGWDKIDELISLTCSLNNVTEIHEEVKVKCIPYSELDFNFQLTHLKIHGYRSIIDLDLDFNENDKIALLGENGSGKSSIIKALQGVFLKNSNLKYEQSDFTDDLCIEVSLLYQNKLFKITKGTKWGLSIDGKEIGYNNLTEFEKDLPNQLPFIGYLDLFFINSNVQNLSTQFNSNRRIELIGKFFRLDKITAYHDTANKLYDDLNKRYYDTKHELDVKYGIAKSLTDRLTELSDIKDVTEESVNREIMYYEELKQKYQVRQLWNKDKENISKQIVEVSNELTKVNNRLDFNIDEGTENLTALKDKLKKTNEAYESTYNKCMEFETLLKNIQDTEQKGSELSNKVTKLQEGICPECGSLIGGDKSRELIESYNIELVKLRELWSILDSDIMAHPKGRDSKRYYLELLNNLKTAFRNLQTDIEVLSNRITGFHAAKTQYDSLISKKLELESKLESHLKSEPEDIKLPIEMTSIENSLRSKLARVMDFKSTTDKLIKCNSEIEEINGILKTTDDKLSLYLKYMEVMSTSGLVYEQILKKLAVKFSTDEVRYDTSSGIYRNYRYINFESYYRYKGNNYRIYESCSDGQKLICDLDFLSKLFNMKVGLLVLDEYLKHLDDNNFSKACNILKSMNVNTLIVSTHDNGLTIYNKKILLNLNEDGSTNASIK